MLSSLILEGEPWHPYIELNKEKGIFLLTGSVHTIDYDFYKPAIDWLKEYMNSPNEKTLFIFKIISMNTGASRHFRQIMSLLKELYKTKNLLEIQWYYIDEDMQEDGEDWSIEYGIPFLFSEMKE